MVLKSNVPFTFISCFSGVSSSSGDPYWCYNLESDGRIHRFFSGESLGDFQLGDLVEVVFNFYPASGNRPPRLYLSSMSQVV